MTPQEGDGPFLTTPNGVQGTSPCRGSSGVVRLKKGTALLDHPERGAGDQSLPGVSGGVPLNRKRAEGAP